MRHLRIAARALLPLLGLATVSPAQQVSNHILSFSASPLADARTAATPVSHQISYKSSLFVIDDRENLKGFRSPRSLRSGAKMESSEFGANLNGQRGLGRLFMLTTCNAACDTARPQLSRSVWVDVSNDAFDDEWHESISVDRDGLTINPEMFSNTQLEFAINGALIHSTGAVMHIGNPTITHYYVQVFVRNKSCRRYTPVYGAQDGEEDDDDYVSIDLPSDPPLPQRANGIVVGAPKVYDTYALQALQKTALQQLQTINPFVAGSITGAYGNLQGVSRDQSYLNVQAQLSTPAAAAPAPSVVNQTATCPVGYYPFGPNACSPIPSGTVSTAPITALTQTVTPSTSTGLTPTIPPAPTYNPLAAPGNVGQSSADALVEQVQLSAQLQTYQLLLQGAQSDALVVQNSRAIGNRAQTTIGFPISIDPPRQFRHAVAEVRVLIEPFPTSTSDQMPPVSIVNLLPSQKTYNVAKVTSKQRAFGGAAVIEQVASIGVSGGKTKDRLYLAKDTDTVALQYANPAVPPLHPPFPDQALTGFESAVRMQRLDECDNDWFAVDDNVRAKLDSKTSRKNSVIFGWQFRPVLGADYVASGPRQVFAQIALPQAVNGTPFFPAVLVQTRWREYDERRQVVGPVFHSSCTVTAVKDPVIIQNPLRIHDTTWEDLGGGTLKIRARGTFLSPGISLQSGKTTYAPVSIDGSEIQFFVPAKDVLSNGGLSLLAENNVPTSLTIPLGDSHRGCDISSLSLWAIPQASGSAHVRMMLTPGSKFADELPNAHPLVLIGSDVYGLKEKPFENGAACDKEDKRICVYHFDAPLDTLRFSGNVFVRNLSWSNSNLPGQIHFAPFLASLSKYYEDPPKANAKSHAKAVSPLDRSVTYLVSGSDLKFFSRESVPDLRAYSVDSPGGVPVSKLFPISDSEALLTLPKAPKGKTITISWTPSRWPLSQEAPIVWDLTIPGKEVTPSITVAPAFLYSGDSQAVKYSGVDFSTVQSVSFEGSLALPFVIGPDDPTTLSVSIPTAVTKEAGHKEFVATTKDAKGKLGHLVLPIDIFKR